jgi:hypothetical protein
MINQVGHFRFIPMSGTSWWYKQKVETCTKNTSIYLYKVISNFVMYIYVIIYNSKCAYILKVVFAIEVSMYTKNDWLFCVHGIRK